MQITRSTRRVSALVALAFAAMPPAAAAQSTPERVQPYALKGVKLSTAEDAPAQTILLRDGRIAEILDAGEEVPVGVRVIDGEGLIATPAFVDGYTSTGCETPTPEATRDKPVATNANVRVDMREANRKGIQPSFRAADILAITEDDVKTYHESGFAALLSSPRGQILAGSSTLASARDAAMRDLIISGKVFQHAAFNAGGSGYPGTLMGYMAQFRQLMLDAQRHTMLLERFAAGRPGPRPAHDADLLAAGELLAGQQLVVCEAETARDIRRWMKLADEFQIGIAISGGRDAWKLADELAARKIPVFLTLNWGEEAKDPDKDEEDEEDEEDKPEEPEAEPETGDEDEGEVADHDEDESEEEVSWEYEEPIGILREKRRLWEQRQSTAQVLSDAGVTILFCSGTRKPSDLLKNVRTLVENGFDRDAALNALTTTPASVLGVERHYGQLTPGSGAAIALWTRDPLEKKAQVAWLIADGYPHEFEVKASGGSGAPAKGVDLTGTWTIASDDEGSEPSTATLTMSEDGKLTGTLETTRMGNDITAEVDGSVSGKKITFDAPFTVGAGFEVELAIEGEWADDAWSGTTTIQLAGREIVSNITATRVPNKRTEGGL
jgi:imidazolonepropionase-like amidohydrolase